MSEQKTTAIPAGWRLEIVYKPIRNIWFRAHARTRVFSVSAPLKTSCQTLDRAIRSKAAWMNERAAVPASPLLIPSRVSHGDTCLFKGTSYPVSVLENSLGNKVSFDPDTGMHIRVKGAADEELCARLLSAWYRRKLALELDALLATWGPRLGVRIKECRIRRMTTRWGSCNTRAGRIWINEALICLASDLLAYVLVHELVHLLEPSHNQRFYRLMAGVFPDWKEKKKTLSFYAPGLGG